MNEPMHYNFREIAESPGIIREYNEILGEEILTEGMFCRSKQYFKEWIEDSWELDLIDQYQRRRLYSILEGLNPKMIKKNAQKEYESTITIKG